MAIRNTPNSLFWMVLLVAVGVVACADESPQKNTSDDQSMMMDSTSDVAVVPDMAPTDLANPPDMSGDVDDTAEPDVVEPSCGNGTIDGGETCDDGNGAGGDGCGADCILETGFTCPEPGQPCIERNICGNGLFEPEIGEACDDGNTNSGDGCDATCSEVEMGWQCPIPGDGCAPLSCGNGKLDSGEDCDDGTNDGQYNGCNANCTLASFCGDGVADTNDGEVCDAGEEVGGYGGCRADCQLEPHCGDER